MPTPYSLQVTAEPEQDLGYLADLYRGGVLLKKIELYPYTVVGPGTGRPPDERRVQLELTRREQQLIRNPAQDRTGVMLGLRTIDVDGTEAAPLILAFAFGIFREVTSRSSIQFPKRLLEEAEVLGASAFAKTVTALGTPTRAITLAMRPEVFPFFLTQLADDFAAPQVWDSSSVAEVQESARAYCVVPEQLRFDAVAPGADDTRATVEMRARAAREILQPMRDRRFAIAVRAAYGHRCAVCDVQLELIEAAHIDPVSDPHSTDDVQNGIALCAIHHLAYDTGLLEIHATGMLSINQDRVKVLADRLRDGGLEQFRAGLSATLRFPEHEEHKPNPEFFRRRTAFYDGAD